MVILLWVSLVRLARCRSPISLPTLVLRLVLLLPTVMLRLVLLWMIVVELLGVIVILLQMLAMPTARLVSLGRWRVLTQLF